VITQLVASHSPQATTHTGPSLILSWCQRPSPLAVIDGVQRPGPCIIISDWAGYLAATRDPQVLARCLQIEARRMGALRARICHNDPWAWAAAARHDPSPNVTLEDLGL